MKKMISIAVAAVLVAAALALVPAFSSSRPAPMDAAEIDAQIDARLHALLDKLARQSEARLAANHSRSR
jgi:hypothetical protein